MYIYIYTYAGLDKFYILMGVPISLEELFVFALAICSARSFLSNVCWCTWNLCCHNHIPLPGKPRAFFCWNDLSWMDQPSRNLYRVIFHCHVWLLECFQPPQRCLIRPHSWLFVVDKHISPLRWRSPPPTASASWAESPLAALAAMAAAVGLRNEDRNMGIWDIMQI